MTLRLGTESHSLPATILLHRTESDYWTRKTRYFLHLFNYSELLVCKIFKLKQCSKVSVENDLFTWRQTRLQFQTTRCIKLTLNKYELVTKRFKCSTWVQWRLPCSSGKTRNRFRTNAAARPECSIPETKPAWSQEKMTGWKVLEIYGTGSPQLKLIKLHLEGTTSYCRMKLSLHLLILLHSSSV